MPCGGFGVVLSLLGQPWQLKEMSPPCETYHYHEEENQTLSVDTQTQVIRTKTCCLDSRHDKTGDTIY